MRHGAKPNGGGHFVNQYTLLMDVMFPAASSGQWRALFQTDPFNHDGNDAEFYVGNSLRLRTPTAWAPTGQFNGSLAPDTWYRIAFAVDLAAPAGRQLSKYVNGVKVAEPVFIRRRGWPLRPGPDGLALHRGHQRRRIHAARLCLQHPVCEWLDAAGGYRRPWRARRRQASGGQRRRSGHKYHRKLLAGQFGLDWARGPFQVQTAANLSHLDWQTISNPSSNRSLSVPASGPTDFYRVMQLQPDIQVGQLPNSEQSLPSKQILRAPGQQLQFGGRPVDLALSPRRQDRVHQEHEQSAGR